ncbi:hypothetical protein [Leptospira wolffii]|uniref:hypothetical protein n=1 Tax=Leptospira wolffii TaxID=409998 RepID=UPI0002DBF7B9|nr:hypothetical protein [Leptospira wolffii]EPG67517.1 hypothetical protein LEP1GSC061_0969 [Leptospira wolffii serovar Khorat str. Khorat-H2]
MEYGIRSFTTEGRTFPVEHMDQYPYYKQIKETLEEKIESINRKSSKRKTIHVEIQIYSEIEKPSNNWVNLSTLTLHIVPLWFQHRIQIKYIIPDAPDKKEFSYAMDYGIYYSIFLAPISVIGSFFDRYENYPAHRIADSVELFLADLANGGEK